METDPRHLLEGACQSQIFSAYQLYAEKERNILILSGGITSRFDGGVPVNDATWFDIGSVTKAVVTTSLCALAVDRGHLVLEAETQKYVPEWGTSPVGSRRIIDLLSHCAGFKAWLPLFQDKIPADGLREWITRHGASWIDGPAERATVYSDLGFLVLGEVVQAVFKKSLEKAFEDEIRAPLGMHSVAYGPIHGPAVAATEVRGGHALMGTVFDENSESLGGKTAHAGLFATATGLAPWCREWLRAVQGKSRWLGQTTARRFIQRRGIGGSSWALGWDTKSPQGSSAGTLFSAQSFGHLGYPGCSVWVDPTQGGLVVFLTNRVHPSREDFRIREIRPALHDAIATLWNHS